MAKMLFSFLKNLNLSSSSGEVGIYLKFSQLGSVARPKDWSEGKESNKEKKRRRWKEIQR